MKRKMKMVIALAAFLLMLFLNLQAESIGTGLEEKKIEDITRAVFPTVVKVEARDGVRKVATGFVFSKDGHIVTTALISPRDEEITVITADGKRMKADFLGLDTETRIGVVQVKEKGLSPILLGSSSEIVPGSWIGVISISPENAPAITQGIVSSISDDALRLNVWVVPGMSGSPVVNKEGRMVGLLQGAYMEDKPVVFEFREKEIAGSGYVFSKAEAPSSGMARAIPVDIVNSVSTEIIKKGRVERGWLGVSISETKDGKVEVVEVEDESPAELAKLKEGDIILKIDGKNVTNASSLTSEIRKRKPGQDIILKIDREGKIMDVKVKLGEYTEEEAKKELELRFPGLFLREKFKVPELKPVKPEKAPKMPEPKPYQWTWEKRKYIGVYLEELNRELAEYFGLKEGAGLLVTKFADDSPAKKAGLRIGDVVIRVDGRRVETVSELSDLIQDKKKGDKIKVEFLRDKKMMSLEIEVEEEERGWESFLNYWPDYSSNFLEQMKKYNDQYRKQIEEFNKLSEEKLKKLNEELLIRNKELTKQYGKVLKTFKNFFRI